MIRDKPKTHGTKQLIDGIYEEGQHVILLEDVITTGSSVKEAIIKLESQGLIIHEIVCIMDREGGGVEELSKIYNVRSLYKMSNFTKQLCFALDVSNKDKFMQLVDEVGERIDILKTHIDIINNVDNDFIDLLVKKSKQYNFKIWEDRKFADIGSIVRNQLLGGNYRIAQWADYISVHLISGEAIIESIMDICNENKIGIFVIYEMSSSGNLINDEYKENVKTIIQKYDIIKGIVTQSYVSKNILHITPGISLTNMNDNYGQQYNKPKSITDIYVIGRDIYENENPLNMVNRFYKLIQNT